MPLALDQKLPPLREELRLLESGGDSSGAAGFLLYDPVRARYFRLTDAAVRALAHWNMPSAAHTLEAAQISASELTDLYEFLRLSELLTSPPEDIKTLLATKERRQHSFLMKLTHSYLFFRIPLIRPENFLDKTLPLVRPLACRAMLIFYTMIGLTGVFFTSRQWDMFSTTFLHFFSLEGFALYGITLIFLKICHELGHAYTARSLRVHVPIMGVAFMVMMPMLYTDISDAWRLKNRRQRFLIAAAGVLTELVLAAFALFFWAFLSDGSLRSAAFFIATTAWITSLLVNLSPFMRFDGYHMLSDVLGIYNLGPRAFALGSWRLREFLFYLQAPPPEPLPKRLQNLLCAYAYGTWIYRLGLFLGIALLVYHAFPKLIGIILFAIEIIFFIAMPILKELKIWYGLRGRILRNRRGWGVVACLGLLAILLILPLDRSIRVPALLTAANEARLFVPEAAQLQTLFVKAGSIVKKNDVIAQFMSRDLEEEKQNVQLQYQLIEARLDRIAADPKDRASKIILEREQQSLNEHLHALATREALLTLRAPFDGIVAEIMDGPHFGIWLGPQNMIAHLVADDSLEIRGLIAETESLRVQLGARARFVAENGAQPMHQSHLVEIGQPGGEGLELSYLLSHHGGAISSQLGADGKSSAVTGLVPARFATSNVMHLQKAERGTLIVDAEPQSLLSLGLARAVSVFYREMGF